MSDPLKLGTRQRYGETTCGYGVDLPACDRPAVWHLYWLDSGHTSATCAEHLDFINSRRPRPEYDIHMHAANCMMPGTWWQFPYEDQEEGYCFFPANDDISAIAEEIATVGGDS